MWAHAHMWVHFNYIMNYKTVKALFSVGTTPYVMGKCSTPFPGFLHFNLDPYVIMLSVKQGGNKYHFCVFAMTRDRIELLSPGQLVNDIDR